MVAITRCESNIPAGENINTMRKGLLLFAAPLLLLLSCGGPKETVSGFMDAVIANQQYNQYLVPGAVTSAVTNYNPASYEVKNVSDSGVSVLITYVGTEKSGYYASPGDHVITGSKRTDISETHIFHLAGGKIKEID
jgi:hypothetical protein